LLRSLLNLIFPPSCIFCGSKLLNIKNLLCFDCASLLQLVSLEECNIFFEEIISSKKVFSKEILNKNFNFKISYVFERGDFLKKILYNFEKNQLPKGSLLLASYMVVQFINLNCENLTTVSYLPSLQYNDEMYIKVARKFARMLKMPFKIVLKKNKNAYISELENIKDTLFLGFKIGGDSLKEFDFFVKNKHFQHIYVLCL
jgi:hypothetical protein